jgi:hypothetical protein
MAKNRQVSLFDDEPRALLDQLLTQSRLYTRSADYHALLEFVVRMPNFAPFNAMLLQVQKPGLTYAASASDWKMKFERSPKEGARPLMILWPFGPVALVYDIQDTEGAELPKDVASFFARGPVDADQLSRLMARAVRRGVEFALVDAGDGIAGTIRVAARGVTERDQTKYRITLNRNHEPNIQFATIAHELGHLFLGHLGPDKVLGVPKRRSLTHGDVELEAESVSYLVCARNGVTSKAEKYLAAYVSEHTTIDDSDMYQILRAAGQVETLLGLISPSKFR